MKTNVSWQQHSCENKKKKHKIKWKLRFHVTPNAFVLTVFEWKR